MKGRAGKEVRGTEGAAEKEVGIVSGKVMRNEELRVDTVEVLGDTVQTVCGVEVAGVEDFSE